MKNEQGQMVSQEIVKEGPTNFITTTTSPEGHAENETRVWSVLADESSEATRGVLNLCGRQAAGNFTPPGVQIWTEVQEWLELAGAKEVVVPFAERLAEMIPAEPVRMRRDFRRLLHLLSVCALLHQRQRNRDDSGRVLASLADYAMVYELVHEAFGRVMRGLTEKTLELAEALETVLQEKKARGEDNPVASYTDIVGVTGRPKYYISRWLAPALQIGLVDNTQETKGKPAALKLGKYALNQRKMLPTPREVAERLGVGFEWVDPISGQPCFAEPLHRCTVAGEEKGGLLSSPADFDEPFASGPEPFADEVHPSLEEGLGQLASSDENSKPLFPPATLQHCNSPESEPQPRSGVATLCPSCGERPSLDGVLCFRCALR